MSPPIAGDGQQFLNARKKLLRKANTMEVIVRVTNDDLTQMQASSAEIEAGVRQALGGGLPTEDGTVYLAGFNVTVEVAD